MISTGGGGGRGRNTTIYNKLVFFLNSLWTWAAVLWIRTGIIPYGSGFTIWKKFVTDPDPDRTWYRSGSRQNIQYRTRKILIFWFKQRSFPMVQWSGRGHAGGILPAPPSVYITQILRKRIRIQPNWYGTGSATLLSRTLVLRYLQAALHKLEEQCRQEMEKHKQQLDRNRRNT